MIVYFPNAALLTWRYQVAEWVWEAEAAAATVAAALVEAAVSEGDASAAAALSSQQPLAIAVLGEIAASSFTAVAEIVAEKLARSEREAGEATAAAGDFGTNEASNSSSDAPLTLLSLALPLMPAVFSSPAATTVAVADERTTNETSSSPLQDAGRREEAEVALVHGRWVLKGYRSVYVQNFYYDPLRQAIADAPYEHRDGEEALEREARKPRSSANPG